MLAAELPEVGTFPWPKPAEADEDPAPLFDSRRDYVEQIGAYKRHQGKPTARRLRRKAGNGIAEG